MGLTSSQRRRGQRQQRAQWKRHRLTAPSEREGILRMTNQRHRLPEVSSKVSLDLVLPLCMLPNICVVPSIPVRREAARVRPDETPSHVGGLSDIARERMEARRRARNMPSTATASSSSSSKPSSSQSHEALEDFQSRANRVSHHDDREADGRQEDRRQNGDGRSRSNGDRNGYPSNARREHEPESSRSRRQADGGTMRVPNNQWDETPRTSRGAGGWGKANDPRRNVGWDETPRGRGQRDDSPLEMAGKEWEEEQVKLDRDWYSYDDEGAVVSCFAHGTIRS